MSKTMLLLADNYVIGIVVLCILVVALHVVFSVRVLLSCRKLEMDVGIMSMIPVLNLILWVRMRIKKYKTKPMGANEEIIL